MATPATPCARCYRWATRCWTSSSAAPAAAAPTKNVQQQLAAAATHVTSPIWANRRRRTRARRRRHRCHRQRRRQRRQRRAAASKYDGPCRGRIRISPTWAARAEAAITVPPGGLSVTSIITQRLFKSIRFNFIRSNWAGWLADCSLVIFGTTVSH